MPMWLQITTGLVSALGLVAGGVLAWVKFGKVEHPASQAQTAHLRAETENITVTTLRETLQEVRELSDSRKNDITDLRQQLRDQAEAHARELREQDEKHARELAAVTTEMLAQINDLRRRLDGTPTAPPASVPSSRLIESED